MRLESDLSLEYQKPMVHGRNDSETRIIGLTGAKVTKSSFKQVRKRV